MTNQTNLDEMARTGCFVSVHVSRPTLRTSLTWKELGLPELKEDFVSPPSTRPPSSSFNEFTRLESRMRACLKRHSAGSEGGFRFMKFGKLGKFREEVEPIRQAYEDAVDPFLAEWDQTVTNALALWEAKANEIYDTLKDPGVEREEFVRRIAGRLRRAWPSAEELRKRFSARVQILQFTIPSEDLMEVNADLIDEARETARNTLNDFFMDAQNELRTRAVETIRRMHSILVKGETVTERSIKPLREFVDQFRQLSIVSDAEFQTRLDSMLATIDGHGGAEGLRDSAEAWDEVRDLLGDVAEEGERLVEEATARKHTLRRKVSV